MSILTWNISILTFSPFPMIILEKSCFNKSIIEETECISPCTRNLAEVAERKALISLSMKERKANMRGNEWNFMEELRRYRRSEEMRPTKEIHSKRKTKSF